MREDHRQEFACVGVGFAEVGERVAVSRSEDVDPSPLDHSVERGAIAVIADQLRRLLLHLRDDIPGVAWPGH